MPSISFIARTLFLVTLALECLPAAAQDIYVDQAATGPSHDGTSWCTAFVQVYEALATAEPGAMIHIAAGRYLPETEGLAEPREATFNLPSGCSLIGGYAGCGAPDPDARDPYLYVTELSGDLAGDDPAGGLDDNVYHVVTADGLTTTITLSGLVVKGGNAGIAGLGGGVLSLGSQLVLMVCSVVENRAWRGGAIYSEAGELHLFQCTLTANNTSGEGGAIFDAMTSLTADNCLFALNIAGNDGGAIFCDLASADFFNCSFLSNETTARGGAIYDYVGVMTNVGNCIFWNNSDQAGSGEGSQIFINPTNSLSINYSCVQGWTGSFGGEGNLGDDPLLSDPQGGDFHLLPTSPCIDQGNNTLVGSQLDLDGNPRIVNDVVDMGCFEYQGTTPVNETGFESVAARILQVSRRNNTPGVQVELLPPAQGSWWLAVYDLRGRRIRRLGGGATGSAIQEINWDGRDSGGRPAPRGTYLFVLWQDDSLLDSRKAIYLR